MGKGNKEYHLNAAFIPHVCHLLITNLSLPLSFLLFLSVWKDATKRKGKKKLTMRFMFSH